jgi:F-type H+-transporting ATPase subunit epsilon
MTKNIQFKIVIPSKALPAFEVAQVAIPAAKGMMTIIPDRAPTTVLLTTGIVEVLDENGEAVKKYFIQGGVANIAANECVIMTERAFAFDDISEEKLQELREEHLNELNEVQASVPARKLEFDDSEMKFYDYISKYLSA